MQIKPEDITYTDDDSIETLIKFLSTLLRMEGASLDSLEKLRKLVQVSYRNGYLKAMETHF